MKLRRCCKSSRQRHLPEEMIFEILLRLSVKSLCRFRCVSQQWRSMIQSPLFVSAYRARLSANAKLLLCLDDGDHGHVFSTAYPILSPENKVEDASSCWCSHGRYASHVLASEAGLICSYIHDRNEIHVANPITGEHINSRTLPNRLGDEYASVICFGYDPDENNHKVLVVRSVIESREAILTVDIFTVGGADTWRRMINPSGLPGIMYFSWLPIKKMRTRSVCIDGTIYIIGMDLDLNSWLVAFDIRTETFRAIPFPTDAGCGISVCLLGLGGAPAFIESPNRLLCKGEVKFRLWILDDFRRQLWSCREFIVPSSFSYPLQLAGTTSRGEVILSHFPPPKEYSTITCLTLYFYRLENSTIKTIEIPVHRLGARLYWLNDLAAFCHIENMQPLRDLAPASTTGTEILYFNNESESV